MENMLLSAFVVFPLMLWCGLVVWIRRIRGVERSQPDVTTLVGFNALLFVAILATAVLIGEVYTRFFHDSTDSFALTKVSRRWFERHYQPNGLKVRDSLYDYALELPPGRHRVTFLGDSFTAGHGIADVEKRFANLIRHDEPKWNVHVFSMNGWDTSDELNAVEHMMSIGYSLDQVVLVYTLNDPVDLLPEWRETLDGINANQDPPFPFDESYFLNLLYFRVKAAFDSNLNSYYDFVLDAYQGDVWREQRNQLVSLHELIGSHGGKLRVVTFPFLHELGDDYAYLGVHQQLDDFWRELGVPHLDLLDTFSSYNPDELVVSRYDAHPNLFAHRIAASEIQKFVARMIARGQD